MLVPAATRDKSLFFEESNLSDNFSESLEEGSTFTLDSCEESELMIASDEETRFPKSYFLCERKDYLLRLIGQLLLTSLSKAIPSLS